MALTGEYKEEKDEKGKERKIYLARFTNGTLEQLNELSSFLKNDGFTVEEPVDVIKTAIAFLVSIKERKEKPGNE